MALVSSSCHFRHDKAYRAFSSAFAASAALMSVEGLGWDACCVGSTYSIVYEDAGPLSPLPAEPAEPAARWPVLPTG